MLDNLSATHTEAYNKAPTLEYGWPWPKDWPPCTPTGGARPVGPHGRPIHSPDHIQRFVDIAAPGAA
ncbi:MAG: hypothetical protein IPJ94_19685 [Chloroflexi bacterium]|nr:hypothetical protein [Chloroflexota bacterium]